MTRRSFYLCAILAAGNALAKKCAVLFDGRVPLSAVPSDFDKNTSLYNYQYVHGDNQTWAEILKFPKVLPSLFDLPVHTKPIEVTISDKSVFTPGGGASQVGFRRSELNPATNNGSDITVQGTTTFHWSVRNDPYRPLNLSHLHHGGWHETADYSTSQFQFSTGKPFDPNFETAVHDPQTWRLAGRQSVTPDPIFFQTHFTYDVWHNFAVTVGWESNLLTVYYSKGYEKLKKVVGPVANDNSGGGVFHMGILKLPTGPLGIDVLHEGYQESHLNSGLIFGGIFIEQSSGGCVTLSP